MRSTALQFTHRLGRVRVVADKSLFVIFDGDCAFCSSCARFLARRVKAHIAVQPWQQTDLASLGLNAAQCSEALQCVDLGRNETLSGHRAVARALEASRFPWSIFGRLIGFAPLSPLGALIYRLVANNRHRLPGGTPACKVTMDR